MLQRELHSNSNSNPNSSASTTGVVQAQAQCSATTSAPMRTPGSMQSMPSRIWVGAGWISDQQHAATFFAQAEAAAGADLSQFATRVRPSSNAES